MARTDTHPPRSTRRTPEAIAERERRAKLVLRAADICGGQTKLALRAGRKGNISQFVNGYSRTPDSLVEVCEQVVKEHEEA